MLWGRSRVKTGIKLRIIKIGGSTQRRRLILESLFIRIADRTRHTQSQAFQPGVAGVLERVGKQTSVDFFIVIGIRRIIIRAAIISGAVGDADLIGERILSIDRAGYRLCLIARFGECAMQLYAYVTVAGQISRKGAFQEGAVRVAL